MTINQGTARSERILQLMNEGRSEEALAEAELWIKSNPHNAEAYGMLAQIYLKSDNLDQALYWSDQSLRYDAENTTAWFVRVIVLYAQGEEREFFKAVKEAQRFDPYEGHYYFLKFNFCRKNGRLQEAREELNKALYMSPEKLLYKAADSYLQANCGDYEASRVSEKGALLREPADGETFLYLAWAARIRGEHQKALEYLEKAIGIEPGNAHLRTEYTNCLRKCNWLYRLLLLPCYMQKVKVWQFALLGVAAWFVYKPLIVVLAILYAASHGIGTILVRVKVLRWKKQRETNKRSSSRLL
ncbi:tetratricopeptide repeat protein [Cohnella kolymensis]|uniref:tetratricopeptide repeat protein n=1 Tax=Cohnella kolymensis TaxID=1590652 RepID=UPI0013791BCD|nr:tetratricopeptide repeat protein [Cohnella kolymensis]